ncbi:putative bifunctional diguanylate cyclase/phosphodiesterase [Aestuariivirga sp.]|uniref:putative bifunctional diguanylate cyclase/phosphodiesterase n=1 Tax=Aestuariivirga sp. TaxID=2650926 RepID=UPI003593DAF2
MTMALRHLRAMLNAMRHGIILMRPDGTVETCNTKALDLLQLPASLADTPFNLATEISTVWGPKVHVHDGHRAALFKWEDGRMVDIHVDRVAAGGIVMLIEDVTEEHHRAQLLRRTEEEYRSLFENAVYGVYRDTLDGQPVRANPALVKYNGYDSEEEYIAAIRARGSGWYVDPDRPRVFQQMMKAEGRVRDLVSEIYRHKTREKLWITENAWYVMGPDGEPLYIEGTILDASERVRSMVEVERQANTDPLTGAVSRFHFMNKLRDLTRDAGSIFVLFSIDLDRFKEVNDILGHAAGDTVLKAVVTRLRAIVGQAAIIARLGGDEFAVIAPGNDAALKADMTAQEIVRMLRVPVSIVGQTASVGASVGIALYPGHAANAKELLNHADLALYQAKASGRDRACFFDHALKQRQARRQALETELREAIPADQLELYYQPIVAAETARVVGYEALMRWNHPRRGLLGPGEFIQMAEDAGLMGELGNWAIDRACRQIARLPKDVSVAVNVSPNQFRSSGIVNAVKMALKTAGLAGSRLTLEVTETVILSGESIASHVMDELQGLGVKLALDDFGTGYSSLSYLQRYAFSKVKIDRSFVAGIDLKPKNLCIIRAIIRLAQDMGMDVIAEGIETNAQAQMLRAENCGYMQGYLFGKPKAFLDVAADYVVQDLRKVVDRSIITAPGHTAAKRTVHKHL